MLHYKPKNKYMLSAATKGCDISAFARQREVRNVFKAVRFCNNGFFYDAWRYLSQTLLKSNFLPLIRKELQKEGEQRKPIKVGPTKLFAVVEQGFFKLSPLVQLDPGWNRVELV